MAFEDVLTFREDVYDLLRQHTPPKQRRENGLPWAISEDVREETGESSLHTDKKADPGHLVELYRRSRYPTKRAKRNGIAYMIVSYAVSFLSTFRP